MHTFPMISSPTPFSHMDTETQPHMQSHTQIHNSSFSLGHLFLEYWHALRVFPYLNITNEMLLKQQTRLRKWVKIYNLKKCGHRGSQDLANDLETKGQETEIDPVCRQKCIRKAL